MSTIKLILTLKKEIKKVNRRIDLRIITGLPYRQEAEYHKRLMRELGRIYRRTLVGKSLRTLSLV